MSSDKAIETPPTPPDADRKTSPWRRWGNIAGATAAGVYLLLQLFPQVLFPYHLQRGPFLLYSRTPLPAETSALMDRAAARLQTSELYHGGIQQQLFLCNSFPLYTLFAPLSRQAFAGNLPSGKVFVANADVAADRVTRDGAEYAARSFSGVIAHETTHSLVRDRLGWFRYYLQRPPDWKNEGYPEVVAGDTSMPYNEGIGKILAGSDDPTPAFRYFKGYMMTRYLLEARHLSFDEMVRSPLPEREVEDGMREWVRTTRPGR